MNAPAQITAQRAVEALDGRSLLLVDPEWTDEQHAAACRQNMEMVGLVSAGYRDLRQRIEALADDHSPPAIWRRAYRRSISEGRAESSRRWKARALQLDPAPMHNALALSGMAPLQVDERWMLAVAIPQPAPTGDLDPDIEDVVVIDPSSGKAEVMGDVGATHVAPPPGLVDRLPVLTNAKEWARHIALERLDWCRLKGERRRMIQAEPTWCGWPTAALLLVDAKKMRWSELGAPILEVPAEMRETVRRNILAQARLPRVEGRA